MTKRRMEDRLPTVVVLEGARSMSSQGAEEAGELAVICLKGDDRPVVVEGRVRFLPPDEAGHYDATESLREWHRETMRLRERARVGERFIVFAEQIARARTLEEVYAAPADHAAALVGGHRAVVHVEAANGPPTGLITPMLVPCEETDAGGPFEDLAPLYRASGAASAAVVPLGEGAILLVLERRRDRTYDPEDWYVLRAIARTAQAALERVARIV